MNAIASCLPWEEKPHCIEHALACLLIETGVTATGTKGGVETQHDVRVSEDGEIHLRERGTRGGRGERS